MKRIRLRLARLAVLCVIAATSLVAATGSPALAGYERFTVKNADGITLGWGEWASNPTGEYRNGFIRVGDVFCDGDNGIIAQLAWEVGVYTVTTLVSVRGCGGVKTNHIEQPPTGPVWSEDVRFSVCKLLPDGRWKDCQWAESINA